MFRSYFSVKFPCIVLNFLKFQNNADINLNKDNDTEVMMIKKVILILKIRLIYLTFSKKNIGSHFYNCHATRWMEFKSMSKEIYYGGNIFYNLFAILSRIPVCLVFLWGLSAEPLGNLPFARQWVFGWDKNQCKIYSQCTRKCSATRILGFHNEIDGKKLDLSFFLT